MTQFILQSHSYQVKEKLLAENYLNIEEKLVSYQYKAFDYKYIAYYKNSLRRADYNIFKHANQNNYFLTLMRTAVDTDSFKSILISKSIIDKNLFSFQTYAFPLYFYQDKNNQTTLGHQAERVPNLNMEIVNIFAKSAGLHFAAEENTEGSTLETNQFHPIDLLDYIYAVLHSPAYREKYKEFLKIDFPRVPYPTHAKDFYDLVDLGSQLRKLHLLESEETENYITQYPIDGNNEVLKPSFVIARHEAISNEQQIASPDKHQDRNDEQVIGKVYINENQYFDNVPEVAWNFYIGGYQPAQKWLKDRKGRTLEFEDILHYQKIIKALSRTGEIMMEIDKVLEV